MNIEQLMRQLTVEEKAALVSGTDLMYTNPVPRLGVPSLRMSDGPHGLRVQTEGGDNGVTGSLPATSFPTAAAVACSWNPENSYKIGAAIGKEAHKYGVHVVLGPGANIKRNPTAGRNFEYFSEDPYLAGKMAAAEVNGIQSKGVGASVKHFALNNSENYRFMGDSVADIRTVREIYLKVFEIIVKESHPATMMCAYNKINGEYCCENKWLLTDVLRNEWGFDGLVMTDWGAMHDRIKSLQTGLDLEMPGDTAICRKWILDGVKSGKLAMQDLDKAVENVLVLIEKYAKKFVDNCDKALDNYGWRLGTGFLSTPFILNVLEELDTEYAYKLLENEQMPGWLFMPKNGATTIWESWEGNMTPDKGIASLNHYSKGAVCEWLMGDMCGIKVAGENKFVISPKPGGSLTYAKAEYQSIYGKVACGWQKTQKGCTYTVTIPSNCTADIIFSDGRRQTVTTGEYIF